MAAAAMEHRWCHLWGKMNMLIENIVVVVKKWFTSHRRNHFFFLIQWRKPLATT